MLTELCQYLRNWFDVNQPKFYGTFTVSDNVLTFDGSDLAQLLKQGQYIRIFGSVFNDGIAKMGSLDLQDETFEGTVWALAIPKDVVALADDIAGWRAKYEAVDSPALSPYNSESFGGYTYSKTTGANRAGSSGGGWQDVFAYRLAPYRKINGYWRAGRSPITTAQSGVTRTDIQTMIDNATHDLLSGGDGE